MHSLAQRVLVHIRQQEFLRAGDRVGVAVSGGIDSVALLRLLLELRSELGIVLSVVHFNHKLRGAESDTDQEFVANLARKHDLEFYVDGDDIAQHAAVEHLSIEAAARELRYGFFRHLLGEEQRDDAQGLKPVDSQNSRARGAEAPLFHVTAGGTANLNKIVTAHTLDDQAETVLMRMIRGAGMKGLGGIYPRIAVENNDGEICGEIMRPLLGFRHCELTQYLNKLGQPWREDSTNDDAKFTRNRLRKRVLPLLEKEFNPDVADGLAELAEIARDEEDYWQNEIAGWMGTAVHWSEPEWAHALSRPTDLVQISAVSAKESRPPHLPQNREEVGHPSFSENGLRSRIEAAPWLVMNASIDRLWFLGEPVAVRRRLVKAIGEQAYIPLEFKHVEEILQFAEADSGGKELSLPHGWKALCDANELVFVTPDLRGPDLRKPARQRDYEYSLAVPGRVSVDEIGSIIEVRIIRVGENAAYNPEHLLDAESLPGPLRVRNWRAGDRFWPAHTKSPKKIKELLQERHIAESQRKLWPVVFAGEEIVWMRGFSTPAKFRARPKRDAIKIAETLFETHFSEGPVA